MSDTVWATLISVIGMLGTAWLTNRFNSQSTRRAADIAERQSATQWQRSESTRKDQEAKDIVRRKQERLATRLYDCWNHVLACQAGVREQVDYFYRRRTDAPQGPLPSVASASACGALLFGFPDIYQLATELHQATVRLELVVGNRESDENLAAALRSWDSSLRDLEKHVLQHAETLA